MPQNFLGCDREQAMLMPLSLREWLDDDHFAWLVLDVVGEIDLAEFYGAYRADGHGRAAHDPAMMVALLLYSYALGQRSSRAIECRCHEDVPTRVICANQAPDHTTIARFRVRHQDALAKTFTQVLALCARAGLVSVGVVALDGTAMAANASPEATRNYPAIREEVDRILAEAAEAAEVDAAEDAEHGTSRGDELPVELADRRARLTRLRRCREELEAEQAQVQAAYDDNLAWRAEWEAEHGRKLGGRKPFAPDPDGLAKRSINTTDPDSRKIVRTGKTAVQGYNAQAVATADQIILAAGLTQQSNDSGQLEPMIATALTELHQAGVQDQLETVLADGGYWNTAHITALGHAGLQVIVPTKSATRTKARTLSPRQGPEAQRIDKILETRQGAVLYRQRQHIIETVFARTKFLRGITRFQRRGLAACRAEWQLIATGHNLLKLHTALTD
jgi:transposase